MECSPGPQHSIPAQTTGLSCRDHCGLSTLRSPYCLQLFSLTLSMLSCLPQCSVQPEWLPEWKDQKTRHGLQVPWEPQRDGGVCFLSLGVNPGFFCQQFTSFSVLAHCSLTSCFTCHLLSEAFPDPAVKIATKLTSLFIACPSFTRL